MKKLIFTIVIAFNGVLTFSQLDSVKLTLNGFSFDTLTWDQNEISYNTSNIYDTYYVSEITDTMVYIDYASDGISFYGFKAGKIAPNNQNFLNNQLFAYTLTNVSGSMDLSSILTPDSDTIYFWIGDQGWGTSKYVFKLIEGEAPSTASVDEYKVINFSVSPNPATTSITINFNSLSSETPIEIFSLNGQKVFNTTNQEFETSTLNIDLTNFKDGIYFIKVGEQVKKLIVN